MDRVAEKMGIESPSASKWISPDQIRRNPDNPRLNFRQKEMDELKHSIYEVGILQPLTVYKENEDLEEYVLIDGERRLRCARELNLKLVPVFIHPKPTRIQNITTMFNIHKLRIDWELMPTALKLSELMELTGEKRNTELSRMCGMTVSQIQQCRQLLFFSHRHQQMVLKNEIKDNFLLEMYPFITKLNQRFPMVAEEYGTDKIVDQFINRERMGHLKSVTEFRLLTKLVAATDYGAPIEHVKKTIKLVIDDPTYEIGNAYDSVRAVFDVEELTRRCQRLSDDILTFNPTGVQLDKLVALIRAMEKVIKASQEAKNRLAQRDTTLDGK